MCQIAARSVTDISDQLIPGILNSLSWNTCGPKNQHFIEKRVRLLAGTVQLPSTIRTLRTSIELRLTRRP